MLDGGEYPAPAVVRVNTRTPSVPHMRLGAWVMISPTWGFPPRRRQRWGESRLFSRITRSTRLRETRMPRQTRSRAQTLRCLALPAGMPPGRPRWPPAEPRPRSTLRSPALCWWALSGGLLPGFHGVERGTGKTPGRTDPLEAVGQTRAGRGGGTHRRDLRRPKGPDVSVLASSSSTCMINSPTLHGDVQFRLYRIALAFLERGIDPGDRLLTPLLEPENLHAQLPRQKFHRLATQKPQGNLTLAVTVHRWPSPSGPAGETGPGKTWTSQARPRLPQAHQQQLCSQNCRSCSGPPWTLRLSQFCVQGNRVRLRW